MINNFIRPETISMKGHPIYSESWVQNIIAEDPSILGLGDLVLRDRERIQKSAGRLDLLLQDVDASKRFEVELQLGATDESHIIRCIEYWDIERKRYPQYEHCAVLVAEDITSRFFNVISLFNNSLPIIAIQMNAMQVGDYVTLSFTKVLDEFQRGLVDEDEDAISAPTDRAYWENEKGTPRTLAIVDRLFQLVKQQDENCELNYNKHYIGLTKQGRANNYVAFRPKRNFVHLEVKLPQSAELDNELEQAGLETLEYSHRWGNYRIRITEAELEKTDLLTRLVTQARHRREGISA